MDHKRTGAALCSVRPGYDFKTQSAAEFSPWAAENVFVPSFPYSPEAHIDDALSSDYPPLIGGQPDWSNFSGSFQSPISAPFPFLSGDVLVPPMGWTHATEADSDLCEFFPIDTFRPMPELDATPNPGWSWSQPSSPSVEVESLPSPPATLTEYKTTTTTATTTRAKAKKTPKLRTASRATRKSRRSSRNSAASPSEIESVATDEYATPEELRARRNHNLVEKQYRNRLNTQFERLLSVLPTDQRWSGKSGDEEGSAGSEDKRMSKAEVLDCATRRIKELESERLRLQLERKELLKSMELMNGAIPIGTTR